MHVLVSCLLNMNQNSKALEYFRKALQIKKRATINAETDTSSAATLQVFGRCLLNMNQQHTELLEYFRRALQIDKRTTTNTEADTSIATTLHVLGRC